jgi:hypothetical protein
VTQSTFSTDRLRTTPAILRAWSVAIVALLAISAVLSVLAARDFQNSTTQIEENTGPVLISTQGLVASIAEADAANTAVFLSATSGEIEDRQQRRLYETAVERAPQQIEDISSGIGDDPTSHDTLKEVASQLTQYAGLVERARLGNAVGSNGATADLEASFDLVSGSDGMLANAALVTERTQSRFDDDITAGLIAFIAAVVALVITLVVMFIAQGRLRRRTKRLLNPWLVMSFLSVVVLTVWLVAAQIGRTQDLQAARDDAYDSIALTAELQTTAFDFKSREAVSIIGAEPVAGDTRFELADSVLVLLNELSLQADSNRESAAVAALQTRWSRYLNTSDDIAALLSDGEADRARTLAIGDGNRDFNGFNTTVESVLLANRDQFNASVQSATSRLDQLLLGSILLPLLAAALALAGYQARINEYW